MSELKPCPFCGSTAKIIGPLDESTGCGDGYCVECTQCMASSVVMYPLMDEVHSLLAEKWNTRHAPDESALLRECRDSMLEAQRMFALLHSHFGWEWPEHNTSTMKVAGQIDTALARLDEALR